MKKEIYLLKPIKHSHLNKVQMSVLRLSLPFLEQCIFFSYLYIFIV